MPGRAEVRVIEQACVANEIALDLLYTLLFHPSAHSSNTDVALA